MPESQQTAEGQRIFIDLVSGVPDARVLDVGAGEGKWSRILRDLDNVSVMDGIEVWEPYVAKYDLIPKYDTLFIEDVRNFKMTPGEYDVIILGDVFEHMPRHDAEVLLERIKNCFPMILLSLPVSHCEQDGGYWGNPYETHHYQWKSQQVIEELGFVEAHVGPNPNGLVHVGSFFIREGKRRLCDNDICSKVGYDTFPPDSDVPNGCADEVWLEGVLSMHNIESRIKQASNALESDGMLVTISSDIPEEHIRKVCERLGFRVVQLFRRGSLTIMRGTKHRLKRQRKHRKK